MNLEASSGQTRADAAKRLDSLKIGADKPRCQPPMRLWSLMRHDIFRTPVWRGYAFAILAWLVAFALRYALAHAFPPGFPYLTFFPAVVLVAYYAGLRPAILAGCCQSNANLSPLQGRLGV